MVNAALVLEGGAMRSLYTSGVLDVLLENDIKFSCIIAVSAGALNAANYISNQAGRSARINIMHSNDSKYYGLYRYLRSGSIFNFDYMYNEPINRLYPYDIESLMNSKQRFIISATNCDTADTVYFEKKRYEEMVKALTASCSMPLMSKIAEVDNMRCLDGGITEPIGFHKALTEGYSKIVVVMTRDFNYKKKPISTPLKIAYKLTYRKYPKLVGKLLDMPNNYNKHIEEIKNLEHSDKLFVISPKNPVDIGCAEKNIRKLLTGYLQGRDEMNICLPMLKQYLYEDRR